MEARTPEARREGTVWLELCGVHTPLGIEQGAVLVLRCSLSPCMEAEISRLNQLWRSQKPLWQRSISELIDKLARIPLKQVFQLQLRCGNDFGFL